MLGIDDHADELVEQLRLRSAEVVGALSTCSDADLRRPSALPGWSRLTIACHLRYGARALHRMTHDALEGRPTAYYPDGRDRQRPSTLEPASDESSHDVVVGLADADRQLLAAWTGLSPAVWRTVVREPDDNPDLGEVSLGVLAMSALTEREVHGTDLDLGLSDWSDAFVRRVLPARLAWLATRRTNHREFDDSVRTNWRVVADDADLVHRIQIDAAEASDETTIRGSSRDLLALLLGRPRLRSLAGSCPGAIDDFERAFPGP